MTDQEHIDRLIKKCAVLSAAVMFAANHVTSCEGDEDTTEEDIGLSLAEVIGMAHDNMIYHARDAVMVCNEIDKESSCPLCTDKSSWDGNPAEVFCEKHYRMYRATGAA